MSSAFAPNGQLWWIRLSDRCGQSVTCNARTRVGAGANRRSPSPIPSGGTDTIYNDSINTVVDGRVVSVQSVCDLGDWTNIQPDSSIKLHVSVPCQHLELPESLKALRTLAVEHISLGLL